MLQQHEGLNTYYQLGDRQKWLQQVDCYLIDLKISNSLDLLKLDRLRNAYQSTILPLTEIAARQGFEEWVRG